MICNKNVALSVKLIKLILSNFWLIKKNKKVEILFGVAIISTRTVFLARPKSFDNQYLAFSSVSEKGYLSSILISASSRATFTNKGIFFSSEYKLSMKSLN